jgi:Na+/proline symporter
MCYLSIDYLIVYAFLLVTLIIGLRVGGGIKDIREYANANKMFGTGALVLTWLATDVAGETILDMTGAVRTAGIIQPLAVFGGVSIAILLQALVFAPRFVRFSDCVTMGDVMGVLYKGHSQVITGVLGFFTALCIAGMELVVIGILSENLGIDFRFGVWVGGALLVLYTTHGGIKSVASTDVFQGLVMFAVLPIITVAALKQAGGIKQVLLQVPTTQLQLLNHPKASYYTALFLSLSVFQFSVIDPALMQRILMGRTKQQLRNQFFIVSVCLLALMVALSLLGLSSIVLLPDESTDVPIVLRIINHILPVGLKGLALAGLIAITMATFDSFLHAAGLTLVHDVIHPICRRRGNTIDELKWVRHATVCIGIAVIVIGSMRADNLYNFVLLSYKFTGPVLAFPLFAGVLGLKPDQKAFYVASGVTTVVILLTEQLLPAVQDRWVSVVGVVTNGIVFLGIHAIRNHGFSIVNSVNSEEYLWRPRRASVWIQLKQLLPTPQHIAQYSQKQVTSYGAPYALFGVFCCVNYLFPYFMWEHDAPGSYDVMLYLRTLGTLACGLLLVRDKWPQSLLPYLPTFWHLTLLYCLPFTSTVMFLLTQGSVEWLINVALTIMFLIVLVDWVSFILLTVLGVALGLLFYQTAIGPIDLQLDFSTGYLLVYQGIFATLIGLLFARRKQLHFDTLVTHRARLAIDNQATKEDLIEATEEKFRFVSMLKRAGIEHLESVAHLSKRLLELSKKEGSTKDKEVTALAQQLTDQLTPMALSMDRFVHRTTGFLLLDGVETVPLGSFLQAVQQAHYDREYRLRVEVRTQHKTLQCDVAKMKKVILNSVAFLHSMAGEITKESLLLGIEDTQLGYLVDSVSPDHVKKVDALRFAITTTRTLPKLAALYMSQISEKSERVMNSAMPTHMPLLANDQIVKAHYGYSSTIDAGSGVALVYVVPVNLREVRSKDMDTPQMQLGASWSRADDTYPGAQEQEKEFFQSVRERSKADLSLVKKAINLIKDYHGPVMRASGEPFYLHPMAVAQIVLDYNQEEATLLGALLHDTVEDTPLTLEQIALLFNEEVRTIVQGVTHMESHKDTNYKVLLSHPENIHRLLSAEDPRVLYVKLADRMHNMRTIEAKSHASQRRTAEETLFFFVSLAKYLHLDEAAEELKQRSFEVLGR